MNIGDTIHVIDGQGTFFHGEIVVNSPKQCIAKIISKTENFGALGYHLHIAIAPTKNISRYEWFLEKCTEIGITEITPLLCDHSERKIIKPQRLEKILIAATKQSLKGQIPILHPLTHFSDFVKHTTCAQKFIAHCEAEDEKKTLKEIYNKPQEVVILIGPEGDFSENEIAIARKADYTEISLGNSRLRTETAGIAACHTIHLANQ